MFQIEVSLEYIADKVCAGFKTIRKSVPGFTSDVGRAGWTGMSKRTSYLS